MATRAICALLVLARGARAAPLSIVAFDVSKASIAQISSGVARDVRAGLVAAGIDDGDVAWVDPLLENQGERAVLLSASVRVRTLAAYTAIACAMQGDAAFPMQESEGDGRFVLVYSYNPSLDAANTLSNAAVGWLTQRGAFEP